MSGFMKILPEGAESFNADAQTDRQTERETDRQTGRQTKLTVASRSFENAPTNMKL
jgi:hypothetical protein